MPLPLFLSVGKGREKRLNDKQPGFVAKNARIGPVKAHYEQFIPD
jgi:hypothetical protein